MTASLMGNPHSTSLSSQLSTQVLENVRLRALRFFNADPDYFDLVFVANATAGIKLVADAFRDQGYGFWYGYHKDSHTSLIGVRELAGAGSRCFASDDEVYKWLENSKRLGQGLSLFAYPAQSNMNGRRLPLEWSSMVRQLNTAGKPLIYTILDAAALVSTSPLDLSDHLCAPDFIVLSFYKIFGFPDLGGLLVRKASGNILSQRKYFGGGTVDMVSCTGEQWHVAKPGSLHEKLEDGTVPIHSVLALDHAFSVHKKIFGSMAAISIFTSSLHKVFYEQLSSLKHYNDLAVCEIYENIGSSHKDIRKQGPIISFNLRTSHGDWVSISEVEKLATIKKLQIRTGGLCNPGGIASALKLGSRDLKRNFSAGQRCGNENDIIDGKPTGVLRVSLGAMSCLKDIEAFLDFVQEFFVDTGTEPETNPTATPSQSGFVVESLTVYPIKSCRGWNVPPWMHWSIKPQGLAWDREWCLLHQGTRTALSQKTYPKMALISPSIDFEEGMLRVRYSGPPLPTIPGEIGIPLFSNTSLSENGNQVQTYRCARVCDDSTDTLVYTSDKIANFFTTILETPCTLARFPGDTAGKPSRHSKARLQPHQTRPSNRMPGAYPDPTPLAGLDERPLIFSNESPILTVSRSSLNRLNEQIKEAGSKAVHAEVFRANIVIAEDPAVSPGGEQPYAEDNWQYMGIGTCVFELLGSCRRCQMVCVNQSSGEKNQEPFSTLARTRRFDGKVYFGQHTGLLEQQHNKLAQLRVGDAVTIHQRRS